MYTPNEFFPYTAYLKDNVEDAQVYVFANGYGVSVNERDEPEQPETRYTVVILDTRGDGPPYPVLDLIRNLPRTAEEVESLLAMYRAKPSIYEDPLPHEMDAYELWERFGQQQVGDAWHFIFDNGYGALVLDNEAGDMFHLTLVEETAGGPMVSTLDHRFAGPQGGMYRTQGKADVLNEIRHLTPHHVWKAKLIAQDDDDDEGGVEVNEDACMKLADMYASMLVRKKRPGDDSDAPGIYVVTEDASQEKQDTLRDMIHAVSDSIYGSWHFPPDTLWEGVRHVLNHLSENWDDTYDITTDVYTRDLNLWMVADSTHRDWVWEAIEESVTISTGRGHGRSYGEAKLGYSNMDEAIMYAQNRWHSQIAEVLQGLITEQVVEAA